MIQDMTYKYRYILTLALLLIVGKAVAQEESQESGSGTTSTGVHIMGSVYGGGNLADVQTNTVVNMGGGTVDGNVFGGGKGKADNFTCDKAMVGVIDDGVTLDSGTGENAVYTLKDGGTTVTITNGTVKGDVYGGGEVGRVERNTIVTIGEAGNTSLTPIIEGDVFGAGQGVETHGYSALVRGNATVTIQGKAKVWKNVHGGGKKASVGRYYVASSTTDANTYHVRIGMPCYLKAGGKCTVNIQDEAAIGKEANTGDVFGAGQGVTPSWTYDEYSEYNDRVNHNSKRMANHVEYDSGNNTGHNPSSDYKGKTWDYYVDEDGNEDTRYVWEYFANKDDYLLYVETLGRASGTDVVIGGKRETTGESAGSITASSNAPTVKGTVYGGSESGFVYHSTEVNIKKGAVDGDVYGGGKGLLAFAEAGRVRINTNLTISDGTIGGNVYGGGSLGDVGRINKSDKTNYNYMWTDQTDPVPDPKDPDSYTWNNTGVCNVTINGGIIGTNVTENPDGTFTKGNVFGAGKGSGETWWCEKAAAYKSNVIITEGTVNGTVYGGGQIGRVEDDATVTIGTVNESGNDAKPIIAGNVFGAGAGLYTHGYSALVRGNATVTVQGTAQVGRSVYGGGEIASVGRFSVVDGLPKAPQRGGDCIVNIKDKAKIGTSGTGHNVYGACKGVDPTSVSERKSMQLYANRGTGAQGTGWNYYETYPDNYPGPKFVWVYYTEEAYPAFLKTLALTSHPHVTIGGTWTWNESTETETITPSGTPSVYGSVYGGGQRGITLGSVDVNIAGGTVVQDVYGGGALANTNVGNWDEDGYTVVTGLIENESPVTGLYKRTGAGTSESPYIYTLTTDETAVSGTTYYSKGKWADATKMTAKYTTTVDLTGGRIKGDAYGGGLGQKTGFNSATSDVPAVVWGDIDVTLNGTAFDITKYTDAGYTDVIKSGRVFGCNNLLGSPQGDVTVTVWKTVSLNADGTTKAKPTPKENTAYELAAVYGGGNLADYTTTGKKAHVIIKGCDLTSIQTVYGGGNAAPVPETAVDIYSTYEIGSVFGGGNGKDKYKNDNGWQDNPGANVNGNTNTLIYGGTVHEAYGASNKKGTIYGNVAIDVASSNPENCTLDVAKLVGAGKDADVDGDLILVMECKPDTKIPLVYGGADNANVNGNVELTITSGNFGKVFGGNNEGGAIMGHIKLNIEETGNCQTPITIDELYLGGNQAAYSQYGYYKDGNGNWQPRTSEDDTHAPQPFHEEDPAYNDTDNKFEKYAAPELNVISCTRIGRVYGGGYGSGATLYGDPIVNINMIPGSKASLIDRDGNGSADGNANLLGAIGGRYTNANNEEVDGGIFGGGDGAEVHGNTTVNIGTATTVKMNTEPIHLGEKGTAYLEVTEGGKTVYQVPVKGAYIVSNVFGGGNEANVTGDTHVNICGTQIADQTKENGYTDTSVSHSGTTGFAVSIGNSVYGGGNKADVKGNTFVTFADGYVFNGIFGGGYSGSVGTFTTSTASTDVNIWGHTAHNGTCIGKPTACENGTGTCYVVVSGGQIGPVEVATQGMNRTAANGGPVPQGWVWGAGCGLVEDPSDDPDTHFKTYVNNTDVTIKGDAFILESIIGGGEFGRVLGNTLVKIEGGQIGVGENKVTDGKLVAYTVDQWTEAEAAVRAGNASRINAIAAQMPACSYFPYGREVSGKMVYDTYDPFADEWKTAHNGSDKYPGGSTDNASDGKTWIGCVFAGGSGYMPYVKRDDQGKITDYDWVKSAGWVEGDAEVRISGGHILSNVYGGNEYTDVKGTCTVKMTGGTVGVPRTVEQIMGNPLIGYIYGAGKGDPRVHFNKVTNVKDVEIEITGGTVFGSVYGGGEDGHVLRDVTMTIGKDDHTGPEIGTWGTSYVDGNVFGGGRGFSGEAYTAGNVAGSVKMDIKGGSILGSVYGGGRMASVGYGLFDAETNNQPTPGYGEMREDTDTEEGFSTQGFFTKGRGHIDITISGGTIGNTYEYIIPKTGAGGNTPNTITETDFTKWTKVAGGDWDKWKSHNNIPKTEFDTTTGRVSHTKGGNVFAGGMGNLYEQNGTTYINMVDWWRLGCVKSTKLTISGNAVIKSNVYGGGELGQVVGAHTAKNAANADVSVGTEIIINGGTIGSEVKDGSNVVQYTFGSVFGSGYGSLLDDLTVNGVTSHPKFDAGLVKEDTKIDMQGGVVKASIYGGGEMASVGSVGESNSVVGSTYVTVSGGTVGIAPITISDTKRYFGGAKMGNVYGGGSGYNNTVRSGRILKNTNVTINGGTIYHNVYGGGAYGTVGDFDYQTGSDYDGGPVKVRGINGLATTGTGVANVTIKGGTIGYDGNENGMVFGSSRGDINEPGARDDHTAWVYDTHVIIGTSGSDSGPQINGTVYGGGENGHVFNDTEVTVHSGTIGIASGSDITVTNKDNTTTTYSGAAYPYRGNVYGGGCGTDKYYSYTPIPTGHTYNDGEGDKFNPLAGIVYGTTTININGGTVVRNVYGAGAMGSVGKATTTEGVTTITSGGLTTINISGGTIGVDGNNNGNVFGAARGDAVTTQTDCALVKNTGVSISGSADVKGNVYGGGETGNVLDNTEVNVCAEKQTSGTTVTYAATSGTPTIGGNVYGGGKGVANSFTCEKAMVGLVDQGVRDNGEDEDPRYTLLDGGTTVRIYNGTVGTLVNGSLKDGTGNVYGGGEIARVERNTAVEIGAAAGSSAPVIRGSVFGAGAGLDTHGYSALVRGHSSVTVQGSAQVWKNVYGGGELASVGRYKVKISEGNPTDAPADLPSGMPYGLKAGGTSTVIIQGSATIGTVNDALTGHVYGAGQGVEPRNYDYLTKEQFDAISENAGKTYNIDEHQPKRMIGNNTWEHFGSRSAYLQFIETLAISAATDVTIGGGTVKGSVFGGSESGFVYRSTDVKIQGGTVEGDAFGGGRGLESFAEAGRVRWNTKLAISGDAAIEGNVYGGGNLGDVGTIYKDDKDKDGNLTYNYVWKNSDSNGNNLDAGNNNTLGNNTVTDTDNNKNTGICTVDISGGTIGLASTNEPTKHGNVYGAGQGSWHTWWCEKAIAYATDVSVKDGTIYGNVYGGGEVGRVEDDAKVTIGTSEETGANKPNITGSVFGGGAGLQTHGYSALVRGDSKVTVQGAAKVGVNVYGGGEIASVGRFKVVGGLPSKPKGGGTCTVVVKDNAIIGTDGVDGTGDVYGSCKGVTPNYVASGDNRSKSMQLYDYRGTGAQGTGWDYYEAYPTNYTEPKFVWVYYTTKDDYLAFLPTLGLASNTHVTIGGSTTVKGSVFGGGQRGVTLGGVDVNINGGTVNQDVYGGGALANSNSSHWHNGQLTEYVELDELYKGIPLKGYYTKSGNTYTLINEGTADGNPDKKYYAIFKTNVNLKGGTVNHNVYGGGLGQQAKDEVPAQPAVPYANVDEYNTDKGTSLTAEQFEALSAAEKTKTPAVEAQPAEDGIEAKVYGDVLVKLNETIASDNCVVKGSIFGCNNLNGSPQGATTVHIYKTQGWPGHNVSAGKADDTIEKTGDTYELAAVYGGGNQAAYVPVDASAHTNVIIDGCNLTSIQTVYGGGNAASTPATNVTINSAYEIEEVFGGGNGKDAVNGKPNPGANVGYMNYSVYEQNGDEWTVRDADDADTRDERLESSYVYGSGVAALNIYGGTIYRVFGGSNTKGNVRKTAVTILDNQNSCKLCIDEAYGGGKSAPMDAEAQLLMACIPGLKAAYGGAQDADIQDDVVLTITNGTFDRIFGGNNVSGQIHGTITVNVEETGCHPIIIGQLYGGGNQAPYPGPDGKGPTLNVKSFTSIGEIYGGGYGETAVVTGDTHVNINVCKGKYASNTFAEKPATISFKEYKRNKDGVGEDSYQHDNVGNRIVEDKTITVFLPGHEAGKIGAINNVYGGGNAAQVDGNTYVNVGTLKTVDYVSDDDDTTDVDESKTPQSVLGADIRGNVYGGGNAAEVTGDTKVVIGKEEQTTSGSGDSGNSSTSDNSDNDSQNSGSGS